MTLSLLSANLVWGMLALLALVGGLGYGLWFNYAKLPRLRSEYQHQQQDYEQQKLRYQQQLKALPARKVEYQKALEQYEAKLAQIQAEHHRPEKIAEFRRERLKQILKQTVSYDSDKGNIGNGHSEKILAAQLKRYFAKKIRHRLTLAIPEEKWDYCPDFAYIDEASGLHIDIEVDEPYTYDDWKPIHYVGKDDRRNDFFLERGWIVIRFSEEQVVKNAQGCCKLVAKVVAELTGKPMILTGSQDIPDLKSMPQWTKEEAERMALTRRRDGYRAGKS